MQRTRRWGVTVLLAQALAGVALAAWSAPVTVDGDLMRGIDETVKSLDSDVATQNADAAVAEAKELVEAFTQVEAYYAAKPDGADGAEFARKVRELAQQVQQRTQAHDFGPAGESVDALTRSCKACHKVYRKE